MSASQAPEVGLSPPELLQKLLRFETANPPGAEGECIAFAEGLLRDAGLETRLIASDPDRPNLVARLRGRGSVRPLLLQGHVDVVPAMEGDWRHPPFGADVADGCIWGRGALDMKGGVAMMMGAVLRAKAERVEPPGDVILALLVDEEAGSDHGAAFLVEHHPELFDGIRYAIGEFGAFSFELARRRFYPIQVAEKQIAWVRARIRAPAGHGSLPTPGGVAARLGEALQRLDRKRLPIHVTPVVREMLETAGRELPAPLALALRQLLNPRLANRILDIAGEAGQGLDPMLHNTASPNFIRAGEERNPSVVPSEVELRLDGRLVPGFGPEEFVAELQDLLGDDIDFELVRYDGGPDHPDMGLYPTLADIIRGRDREARPIPMLMPASSDGRFFSRLGIQTYGFLPMPLPQDLDFNRLIHGADERIPIGAVDFGTSCIYDLLERFDDGDHEDGTR
jgi:acetylornithine deacetylase/succinyl-diaminopimelate desuccinylase-like protein